METHLNGLRRTAVRLYISPSTQIKPVPMSILLSVTKECRRLLRSSFLLPQILSSDCYRKHSVIAETCIQEREENKTNKTNPLFRLLSESLSHRRNKKPETRNQDFNNTQSPQKPETRNQKPETRNQKPETTTHPNVPKYTFANIKFSRNFQFFSDCCSVD